MNKKEALEIVRKNYPHVGTSGSEFETALRELVPELKENEDERIRTCIVDVIKENDWTHIFGVKKEDCLAYLERQKDKVVEFDHNREQKPAEWSEEEMRKIVELKYFITQCNGFNKENRKKAFDMIDAFRPRPHWKPSEEQMNALKVVAHGYQSDDLNAIESLLNDLQKLL